MDLGLELIVRGTGRQPADFSHTFVRELTLADVKALEGARGSEANSLKRLSDRHHALARNLAAGIKPGQAGAICGYDASRVSILQADPMFRELVEFYRSQEDKIFRDTAERLAGVTNGALDLIEERLEDPEAREKITIPQALAIAELGADRSGFGPASTNTPVNVHVGLADALEARRKRAREAAKTIEAVPREAAE